MSEIIQRKSPVETAKKLLNEKYPHYSVAFVAGSFNRGEETATSDIDLVVVLPKVEQAWRESLIYDGWPVELLIHDEETLKYFFYEVDAKDGIPSLPNMVFEAPAIPSESSISSKLKDMANEVLNAGPPPLTDDEEKNFRYIISDLLDDLRSPRTSFEGMATVAKLHGTLAFFLFRSKGTWAAGTKHIPRRMQKIFPDLYPRWEKSFQKAFAGDFQASIELTEEILSQNGGYLFDGYHRLAPKEWRLK
jgi:predicted nucleotidyltransferase